MRKENYLKRIAATLCLLLIVQEVHPLNTHYRDYNKLDRKENEEQEKQGEDFLERNKRDVEEKNDEKFEIEAVKPNQRNKK